MTTAEAVDDVHPNTENANISAHAEMSWYEPLVASNRSFDDRDRDCAAAVALGEAQNGMGQKLVDGAGEITEEAQRAQSHKDILSDSEKHTHSDQLLHLGEVVKNADTASDQEDIAADESDEGNSFPGIGYFVEPPLRP